MADAVGAEDSRLINSLTDACWRSMCSSSGLAPYSTMLKSWNRTQGLTRWPKSPHTAARMLGSPRPTEGLGSFGEVLFGGQHPISNEPPRYLPIELLASKG